VKDDLAFNWKLLAAFSLLVWACWSPYLAFAQEANKKEFVIDLKDDTLTKLVVMKVRHHDQVTWKISSNTSGELHMHAYHLEVQVKADQPTQFMFNAKASGRFQISWHPDQQRNQPTKKNHHDALAYLEVYPK
jgi:prephenate dehydrogenase